MGEPYTHTHDRPGAREHTHVGDPFEGTKDYRFWVIQRGPRGDDATGHWEFIAATSKKAAVEDLKRRVNTGILASFREKR
jgi:hypothetical protein